MTLRNQTNLEKLIKLFSRLLLLTFIAIIFFNLTLYLGHVSNYRMDVYAQGNQSDVFLNTSGSFRWEDWTCAHNIVYVAPSFGHYRLANKLMAYTSAWALAKRFNLTAVADEEFHAIVFPLFDGLSMVPGPRFFADLRSRDPLCAAAAERQLRSGRVSKIVYPMKKMVQQNHGGPVIVKQNMILYEPIFAMRTSMKKEFRFRAPFLEHARGTLQNASQTLRREGADADAVDEVMYVGVHVRRTDYMRYLKKTGIKKYVDVAYYLRATDYMLGRLRTLGSLRAAFVVASDDMQWCHEELIPQLRAHLASKNIFEKNVTVSWGGSDDPRNDIAMLSSCNHSIFSYGTYGTWSSLMAGGWTTVFNIDPHNKGNKTTAMKFAYALPKWKVIN